MTPEEEIQELKKQVEELKNQMELHWQVDERNQKEMKELKENQHKETVEIQKKGNQYQMLTGLSVSIGTAVYFLSSLIKQLRKIFGQSKEVVSEISKNVKEAWNKGQQEQDKKK